MVANNVLAHVPDINDFVRGFSLLLKPNGVATFENPHLLNLVENNQFEVPKAQVEEQKKLLLQDVKQRFEQQGMGEAELANYAEKWADDLDKTAKFMVQSGYVINHLAKENDVQVGDEDIRKKLEEYAAESGIDVAQLEEFYKQGDSRSRLSYQILEEKVVDQLAEAANVSEVSKDKLES